MDLNAHMGIDMHIKVSLQKSGVATLMHLPKGRVWKIGTPLNVLRMLHATRRVHSYALSETMSIPDIPFAS